jgi:hypothetical protein
MKEGRSSDSVEYISDESGDDVEEHGDQDKLSNFNEPESNHSGESPVFPDFHFLILKFYSGYHLFPVFL